MASPCCHLQCLHQLSVSSVLPVRNYYANLSEKERRQLLWESIKHGDCARNYTDVKQVTRAHLVLPKLRIDRFLCAKALQTVTGAGIWRIRQLMQLRTGELTDEDVLGSLSRAPTKPSLQHEHLHAYVRHVVKDLADNDPVDGSLHMPMGFSLENLHRDYCDDADTKDYLQHHSLGDPMTLSTLRRIWHESFSNVKVPRQSRLGKCDTCFTLGLKLLKKDLGLAVREGHKQELRAHHQLVMAVSN